MRRCLLCGGPSSVEDTRETETSVRRRRKCRACGESWTTVEVSYADFVTLERFRRFLSDLATPATFTRVYSHSSLPEAARKALKAKAD